MQNVSKHAVIYAPNGCVLPKQINLVSRASRSTVQFSGNYAVELAIFTMTTFGYNYQYSFRFCFLIQIWHPAED